MSVAVAALLALAVLAWPAALANNTGPVPTVGSSWAAGAGGVRPEAPPEDALSVAAAIDLLALALTSGVPLTSALESVASRSGPAVRSHLRQVSAALQWGVDGPKAWEGLPALWQPVGGAIAIAGQIGMPAAGLLREAAGNIRAQERQRLQERTARLGVLIVLPLGGCFLPAFAVLTVVPVVAVIAASVLHGS